MSTLRESGTTTESMPCSTPLNSANARSKRSTAKSKNVQLAVTKEVDSQVVAQKSNHKRANPLAWFTTMGVMLVYGMYQHDNTILFSVMILVTVGCGYGHSVEVLLKYLKLRAPTD